MSLEIPWVEKYRPTSLNDVWGQTHVVTYLQSCITKLDFPHFLFAGSAGTGKTSAAMAFIHDVYSQVYHLANIPQELLMFTNASDENRLEDNAKIKEFVSTRGLLGHNIVKFVVLDECDNMSREKQGALRRVIETAPPNVKFILMCNYIENLLDPIISRCSVFRFSPLPHDRVIARLQHICTKESLMLDVHVLDAVYTATRGDLRSAINSLQLVQLMQKHGNTDIDVYRFFGVYDEDRLNDLGMRLSASEDVDVNTLIDYFPEANARNFLRQLTLWFCDQPLPIHVLKQVMHSIAIADFRLSVGTDHSMQMDALIAELQLVFMEGF